MMEDEKFSIVRLVKVNDSENSECFIIALCLEQAESIIFYVCYKNHHHVLYFFVRIYHSVAKWMAVQVTSSAKNQ